MRANATAMETPIPDAATAVADMEREQLEAEVASLRQKVAALEADKEALRRTVSKAQADGVRLYHVVRRREWRARMLAQISRTFGSSLEVRQVARTVAVQLA